MKKLNSNQRWIAYGSIATALLIALTTELTIIGAIISLLLAGMVLGIAICKMVE